jgi:intron-binding protein aquarius
MSQGPPFVLETLTTLTPVAPKPSRKRRRDEAEPTQQVEESLKISTYRPPASGPYPADMPRMNRVRFTPAQIAAIASGTQPGLTVIVGPPGTGKTDVATQIINNIYHDFPSQRTLLLAHSNQALNQLFQKIMALDIDGRHLLRLGQGEGDLETAESFSKYGRVESFLDSRAYLLAEVDRLATSFGAPGAHGSSCETAGYFNSVYVQPAWSKFWDQADAPGSAGADIISAFPYHHYFQDAPQPLFPPSSTKQTILDIVRGCQSHITRIFTALEDIRPFEILRSNKDKTNYLMIKEARIIAMTTTHAAMRRREIADLGFQYDNVIMEEAAQITEIDNFIPLALQKPRDDELPLQRVVLCGDHLQNSPIIQNMAFRQFANLEQSLFLRLVRLGVPTMNLDQQGRARSSIAELYKWRYPDLKNLPYIQADPEYTRANAGFKYEYQFIEVTDYKGAGESQPNPHFFQNLGEAEYAVAMYQYMRLLGYPASRITILTAYAGQRTLIKDVLGHRCAKNRLFGMPRSVTTVDRYQGEQNDYIILSLTRTRHPGYLRDIRRLTVALSRARLGLYILGRRSVFQSSPELLQAFKLPLERPEKLVLTTNEVFPAQRLLEDKVEEREMEGVEHLGQYVFEMTQAKVEMLKRGEGHLLPQDEIIEAVDDEGMDSDGGKIQVEEPEETEMDNIT